MFAGIIQVSVNLEYDMKQVQQGFTLIELMIVVAIIGILAAVAVPQYQQYTVRGQISEGLAMASEFKAAVSEFYSARGAYPTNNAAVSFASATNAYRGNYVSDIQIQGGNINIRYSSTAARANAAIDDDVLTLTVGLNAGGSIVWRCGTAPAPQGATMETPTTATSVANQYLPNDCRT